MMGYSKRQALLASILGFLGLGGLKFFRLLYVNLPRDLKWVTS